MLFDPQPCRRLNDRLKGAGGIEADHRAAHALAELVGPLVALGFAVLLHRGLAGQPALLMLLDEGDVKRRSLRRS